MLHSVLIYFPQTGMQNFCLLLEKIKVWALRFFTLWISRISVFFALCLKYVVHKYMSASIGRPIYESLNHAYYLLYCRLMQNFSIRCYFVKHIFQSVRHLMDIYLQIFFHKMRSRISASSIVKLSVVCFLSVKRFWQKFCNSIMYILTKL